MTKINIEQAIKRMKFKTRTIRRLQNPVGHGKWINGSWYRCFLISKPGTRFKRLPYLPQFTNHFWEKYKIPFKLDYDLLILSLEHGHSIICLILLDYKKSFDKMAKDRLMRLNVILVDHILQSKHHGEII